MPAITANQLITDTFVTAGIAAPGASISATMLEDGLRRLNNFVDQLALQPLSIPVVVRNVFPITALKGGPENPYTIGIGGDFNVERPIALTGAAILLVQPDPTQNVEVPIAMLTDTAWQAVQIKDLQSTQFTDIYYNPTYATDRGTINLWPVPTITTNQLVLYWRQQLANFANTSTSYYFPQGAQEMLEYGLARRLLTPYGITDSATVADVKDLARASLAMYKRSNTKLIDLQTDPALTHSHRGIYNIQTGTGGGS